LSKLKNEWDDAGAGDTDTMAVLIIVHFTHWQANLVFNQWNKS
jgi:hypothetical protein